MTHSFTNNIFDPVTHQLLFTKCTHCGARDSDPNPPPCPHGAPSGGGSIDNNNEILALREDMVAIKASLNALTVDFNLETYDIWTEGGRSQIEQEEFKKNLIKFYKRGRWWSKNICCMATGVWGSRDKVIASHIWKQYKHGVGLPKFGLHRQDATSPRNGLLLLRDIELKFDVKEICFVYDSFRGLFLIKVLNPNILSMEIANSGGKTFASINDKPIQHPKKNIPFRRLLSFHARCSFLAAKEKGWISELQCNAYEPYHSLSESASVPDIV